MYASNKEMKENENDPYLKIVLKGHRKPITDISFHPDPTTKQFASGSGDGTLMVWNLENNSRSYNYIGHTNSVTGVEYSSDGKILASCSLDNTVRLWASTIRGSCSEFRAHLSPILTINFSPDSRKLITGARDKSVKMWDVSTKAFLGSFLGHNNWVRTAKYFSSGNVIASGSDDKTLRLWDVLSNRCIHTFVGQEGSPVHIAPYPNDNSVAVATSSGAVRIYELRTLKLQQHYILHTEATYVAWHPFDNYLLSAGKDSKVRIIDVMEGRPIYTVGGHDGAVTCVKFSTNGEYFVTGGDDKYVMVWKTNFISAD